MWNLRDFTLTVTSRMETKIISIDRCEKGFKEKTVFKHGKSWVLYTFSNSIFKNNYRNLFHFLILSLMTVHYINKCCQAVFGYNDFIN